MPQMPDYPLTAADCRAILETEPEARFVSPTKDAPVWDRHDPSISWAFAMVSEMRFRRLDAPEDKSDG